MAGHTKAAPAADTAEVLSVSDKNPNIRTVRVARPAAADASFIGATLKGLGITLKHFFTNIRLDKSKSDIETIQYPEEPITYPERNRGLHRLMHREDGNVRCVACMCCPTVCPANCITIVPAETELKDNGEVIEKYPATFEIDELRCVVCGLCVEACPCDAIRMDSGRHAPAVEERGQGIMDKDELLAVSDIRRTDARNHKSAATQGGVGPDWKSG